MLNEERRRAILQSLGRDGRVLVGDLARQFETSQVTIRKDLEILHAHGLLHRTHGGALPFRDGALADPSLVEKEKLHRREKVRIAESAAAMVQEGQVVILDSGTTTTAIARALRGFHNLTIVTNAVIDGGTSGGPLLNVGSQVVGIAIESPSTVSGFGLNVADIQDDVQQILTTGQVVVASLGATTSDMTPESAALNSLPEGSQVVSVDRVGAAAAAGLRAGDVITQIDDVRIDPAHPLSLLLRSRFHPNQRVTVTYTRAATSTQAELTLTGQHPSCS